MKTGGGRQRVEAIERKKGRDGGKCDRGWDGWFEARSKEESKGRAGRRRKEMNGGGNVRRMEGEKETD